MVVTSRSFARADPAPQERMEQAGLTIVRADPRHDLGALRAVLPDAVAWVAGTSPVTEEMLDLGARLKVVARYGVGYDAVDLEAARRRGVWVTNTPGANTDAVADLAIALLLDSIRHVSVAVSAVREGDWTTRSGREVGTMTVGVVGFGRIGQAVACRLLGFGATVLAVDPQLETSPIHGVELVDLDTAATKCDAVTLHAPGGSVMMDERWLARLRPGATLVNTARGDLVDEQAVAEAIRVGTVASYACDTLSTEHNSSEPSPLQAPDLADHVLITPHIGAQTAEAVARMGDLAADNVLAVLGGETPPHPVARGEEPQ